MRHVTISFVALSFISVLASCAPARFVKPLAKGEQALTASLGGPLIKFAGAPVPIPLTTICYGKGITDKITLFSAIHLTSALFGNAQAEAGMLCTAFEKKDVCGVSFAPAVQMAYHPGDAGSFRIWPTLDV